MKRTLLLALIPLLAGGCLGGGTAAPVVKTAVSPAIPVAAATEVGIHYPVGRPVTKTAHIPACPHHATCHVLRLARHCRPHHYCAPQAMQLVAHRRLVCGPDSGDYAEPSVACAALDDLIKRVKSPPQVVCYCPFESSDPQQRAAARGRFRAAPGLELLKLDGCSLCGHGPAVAHDASVLMPPT